MILPTLRQLQYLIALKDTGSFTKAAAQCLVSQPSLSNGIQDLEHTLGAPLLDRSAGRVHFTPLGIEIYDRAQSILQDARSMITRAQISTKPMSGVVRLGSIPTIAPYIVPRFLPALRAQYPDLDLQLYEGTTDSLLDRLARGTIDVALMALPYRTKGLSQNILFEEPFLLALPKDHDFQTDGLTPGDLDPDQLLLLEDEHCLSDHIQEACAIQPGKRGRTYSASSLATLLQMVAAGYGMTLVPRMAQDTMPDNVKLIPFVDPKPKRGIGLVWRPDSLLADDIGTLGNLLHDQVAAQALKQQKS